MPFAIITTPLSFAFTTRAWSVAHRHGLLTPGDLAPRFGSRGLGAAVALTGIAATMPYIAVQLSALRAVLRTVGVPGEWPLLAAVAVISLATFRSGLRTPALLSIAKDVLLGWVVIAALLVVAMSGGWGETFRRAGEHFAATPSGSRPAGTRPAPRTTRPTSTTRPSSGSTTCWTACPGRGRACTPGCETRSAPRGSPRR